MNERCVNCGKFYIHLSAETRKFSNLMKEKGKRIPHCCRNPQLDSRIAGMTAIPRVGMNFNVLYLVYNDSKLFFN